MKRVIFALLIIILILILIYFWLGKEMDAVLKNEADGTNEYVVILGAKVKPGGIPSLSLKNRLDVALDYLRKHPSVKAIVTGGQGADEDRTEASVMAAYLIEHGIDQNRIMLEDQSTSTYENLLFAKELLPEDVTNITIISNDFHLKRAVILANKVGLQADVLAAPTPKSVNTKSRIRERLALIKAYVKGQ
ncbi:YdcF family protein [Solibacillus sp. A46]|uniref:YdcF family protein n=1 Tax=Solibacillus faecavium TaxID=2762221 RepID=A0ABR8XW10_9BACL|nr:YdcF family protein [Solibacillus faecavium]MBD8036124.1 YdcF family protein [Solibacillus faecavium]